MAEDRRARQVWGDSLVGFDGARDDGRDGVEAGDAPVFGAEDVNAIEGDGGVAEAPAAEVHKARFALVAFNGEAGHAGQRGGERLVWKPADRVGGDNIDDIVGIALGLDGGLLAVADR